MSLLRSITDIERKSTPKLIFAPRMIDARVIDLFTDVFVELHRRTSDKLVLCLGGEMNEKEKRE